MSIRTSGAGDTMWINPLEFDQARDAGREAGALAERRRWETVLGSPEAKHKQKTAAHILMNTDLDVEAARKLLAGLGQGCA